MAFFLLLFINLSVIIYLILLLYPPNGNSEVDPSETQINRASEQNTIDAVVSLGNKDLEELIYHALQKDSNGQEPGMNIEISDSVKLRGQLMIVGFEVNYQIDSEPFVEENGNLQLKVSTIELGSLSLPTQHTLQLLESQLNPELPLAIDSENKTVTVLLNQVHTETVERIELKKIEKDTSEYIFNITILKKNLLQ